MLQTVRMSVGQTWRFVDAQGKATVAWDKGGHRQRLNALKNDPTADSFQLPWPPYRSRLWGWFLDEDYENVLTTTLVGALLPLLFQLDVDFETPESAGGAWCEAVLHPFAVTTILHLNLFGVHPWPPDQGATTLLHAVLARPVSGGAQIRDGIPLALLPTLPSSDFQGAPASFQPAGRFTFLSGLHQEAPDPPALAHRLASLFESSGTGRTMKGDGTGIGVTSRRVGVVWPRAPQLSGAKLRCLHQNFATLLAYMQNLATLMPAQPSVPAEWFQGRAALILNHLYRRSPVPELNSIYKSQLAEMWIAHLGLPSAINAITAGEAQPPPALPA